MELLRTKLIMQLSRDGRARMGDLVGLVVLAAAVSGVAQLVPLGSDHVIWWLAYGALALIGIRMWNGRNAPQGTHQWLIALGVTLLFEVGSFAIDLVLGRIFHSDLPLIEGATHVYGPFGFGLTAILIPAVLMVVLCGYIRALVVRMLTPDT